MQGFPQETPCIAAVPLVISLVLTGMAQDQQKSDGDLTYNEGDKFWIIQDRLSPLSSELEQFHGQEGEITEVNANRSVEMKFADGSVGTFWLTNLSNIPPEPPKAEKKGWWQ